MRCTGNVSALLYHSSDHGAFVYNVLYPRWQSFTSVYGGQHRQGSITFTFTWSVTPRPYLTTVPHGAAHITLLNTRVWNRCGTRAGSLFGWSLVSRKWRLRLWTSRNCEALGSRSPTQCIIHSSSTRPVVPESCYGPCH